MKIFKRYLLLAAGLFIMAFGVATSIKAGLGTSPISSVPYTLNLITGLSVGKTTICLHVTLIILQILLLRKRYEIIQLMQLPVAIVFGYMTDFAIWALSGITVTAYPVRWLACIIGILLVGIGVSCEVTANVVVLAGEGLSLAICKVTGLPFPKVKISFDVSLVVIAILLGLVFLGSIQGVREGTVAAALTVGLVSKQVSKPLSKLTEKFF